MAFLRQSIDCGKEKLADSGSMGRRDGDMRCDKMCLRIKRNIFGVKPPGLTRGLHEPFPNCFNSSWLARIKFGLTAVVGRLWQKHSGAVFQKTSAAWPAGKLVASGARTLWRATSAGSSAIGSSISAMALAARRLRADMEGCDIDGGPPKAEEKQGR